MSAMPSMATESVRRNEPTRGAMCGRLRVDKDFLHVCSIGRCSHVFGLWMRLTWPLAIMPSADQVPVKSTHSTMHWHMWVVLIAGSTGSALRAVRPPNLHIRPVARRDLVMPPARRDSCNARPWPSSPRPFGRAYWRARWQQHLVGRRANNAVSQGRCLVPWILA
jgi:hypothetical protein